MLAIFPSALSSTDVGDVTADPGVYEPQQDSHLLIEAMQAADLAVGRRVADICTGSGVVAIAAAQLGARSVTAFDVCADALACARRNATAAGVPLETRHGDAAGVVAHGRFDLIVANPPYVPAVAHLHGDADGPSHAWDAGPDGRLVLDPLCAAAPDALTNGGVLLIVQSEFADPHASLRQLRRRGLSAEVVLSRIIPFGPVMRSRADWMERTGRLDAGRRHEEIVVIRAERQ